MGTRTGAETGGEGEEEANMHNTTQKSCGREVENKKVLVQ